MLFRPKDGNEKASYRWFDGLNASKVSIPVDVETFEGTLVETKRNATHEMVGVIYVQYRITAANFCPATILFTIDLNRANFTVGKLTARSTYNVQQRNMVS